MIDRLQPDALADVLRDALRPIVAELVAEELQRRDGRRVEWQTVEDYAADHQTTPGAIRQRCLRGQIPGAVRDGARWLIPVDAAADAATVSPDHSEGGHRANGPARGTGGTSSHAR